ncbi:MAG TPA: entericidin A/B family lipoprotein [Burkholderiales bacterium]|nr:entericidin A/B family lipoprotein [Burkholderiales bacterium]
MKKVSMILIALAVLLAGCNTMHGVGKDVEKAGEAIQRKSDR